MEKDSKGFLFVFRLKRGENDRTFFLKGLNKNVKYTMVTFDGDTFITSSGEELSKGLTFQGIEEERSLLYSIHW